MGTSLVGDEFVVGLDEPTLQDGELHCLLVAPLLRLRSGIPQRTDEEFEFAWGEREGRIGDRSMVKSIHAYT
jgi:hypothetical protein